MGLACDADARGAGGGGGSPNSPGAGAGAASGGNSAIPSGFLHTSATSEKRSLPPAGMNAEETALILASLSKGKFGPVSSFAAEDSDPDDPKHSDIEDLSGDDDDDDDDDEHGGSGGSRVHRVQQINFDGPVGSKLDFTDDAGLSHRFRNESNRVKSLVTKHISIDELRAHFDRPIIDVAKDFGICITLMKKICRRNGIKRWPHRQIRSLSKSIASMEAAMLSTHGSEREKYRDQISSLRSKRESVISHPNKDNGGRPKTPTKETSGTTSLVRAGSGAKLSPHGASQYQPSQSFVPIKTDSVGVSASYSHHHSSATGGGSGGSSHTAPTHAKGGRWTSDEHAAFLEGIRLYGKDWRRVAQVVGSRSAVQTRTHAQKYLLKFAGRFPFDAGDSGASSSSAAAIAAVAGTLQDTNVDEPQSSGVQSPMTATVTASSRVVVEAMAMILNSPDSVASQASASPVDEDVPMYSPMSTSSAMGCALPSLAMPAIKMEQRKYELVVVARDGGGAYSQVETAAGAAP